MTEFYIADTHFFHNNIIRYCNRPYASVEEMNEALIDNWNKTVQPNDTIRIVGDFAFGGKQRLLEVMPRLNGNKILIHGNHDYYKKDFYLSAGFVDFKYNDIVEDMFITHFPIYTDEDLKRDLGSRVSSDQDYTLKSFAKMKEIFVATGLKKVIHGHIHEKIYFNKDVAHLNVGADRWNFTPITLEFIKEYFANLT